jgi:hypothetical protein
MVAATSMKSKLVLSSVVLMLSAVAVLSVVGAPAQNGRAGALTPSATRTPVGNTYFVTWSARASAHWFAREPASGSYCGPPKWYDETFADTNSGRAFIKQDPEGNVVSARIDGSVTGQADETDGVYFCACRGKLSKRSEIRQVKDGTFSNKYAQGSWTRNRGMQLGVQERKGADGQWVMKVWLWGPEDLKSAATDHPEEGCPPPPDRVWTEMYQDHFRKRDFEIESRDPDRFTGHFEPVFEEGTKGGAKPYTTYWDITVRRVGKCLVGNSIPINDQPENPTIKDEEIHMGVEGKSSINPDTGVALLNIRVTCDQVPVKNTLVNVKIDVQTNTGGHLHDASDRPVGTLNGIKVIGLAPAARWWFRTDGDGRVHLIFKPAKALSCPASEKGGDCDNIGIAGIYRITATPDPKRFPGRKAEVAIEAKVDGLSPISHTDSNYVDDVRPGSHTSGDYATATTQQALHQFGIAFHDAQHTHNEELAACGVAPWRIFYPLWVIDVSLPFGGLYDLGPPPNYNFLSTPGPAKTFWSTPHQTHGRGDGVDFSVDSHGRCPTCTTAWPPTGAPLPVCAGYKLDQRIWLEATMMEVGARYGDWDAYDLCTDYTKPQPKCPGEPRWHLRVKQKQ